jgi:L-fuculose-phosphate aldolase
MTSEQSLKEKLVIASQALGLRGCGTGIGGHVSIRVPGEEALWINAFDRTLSEITIDDVLMIDFKGNIIEGGREVSVGYAFHPGIYKVREDVNSIVHTHGPWGTALGGLARPLKIRANLACFFHNDQALSPDDSFSSIGPVIGEANTVIIPWHGCITVGTTIGRATALHATLEDMARLDVLLEPSGAPEIPLEWRDRIKDLVDNKAGYLEQTWELMKRQVATHLNT